MVVAQLVERSLPTPVRTPTSAKFYLPVSNSKDENKEIKSPFLYVTHPTHSHVCFAHWSSQRSKPKIFCRQGFPPGTRFLRPSNDPSLKTSTTEEWLTVQLSQDQIRFSRVSFLPVCFSLVVLLCWDPASRRNNCTTGTRPMKQLRMKMSEL